MDSDLLSIPAHGPARDGIHIGCSGWVYRHWKELFYPATIPQKRWFEHYADHFNSVEINASFYRLPLATTFAGWQAKAPAGFRYAVKVNRFITHNKKLGGVEDPLAEFIALARGLGPALGPLLSQLPPNLHRDDARLAHYLGQWPADLDHVVEFRHGSWYHPDVLALLDTHGAGFVAHDLVGLVSPAWASGRTAYVRFHGTSGKYWGRYTPDQIASWADWLRQQRAEGRSAWAFFNNDIHGHALEDARALMTALAD
jgi:uncharacterized protein YecE (DUF72 family)